MPTPLRPRRAAGLVPVLALLTLGAQAASARPTPSSPLTLALDLEPGQREYFAEDEAESVSRRVATYLVPQLEAMGYRVERVDDARARVKRRDNPVGAKITIDAKPRYLVHDARRWDGKLAVEASKGVLAWGFVRVYGGERLREIARGPIPRMESAVHDAPGGGRPEYDDEDAVARRLADHAAAMIERALE